MDFTSTFLTSEEHQNLKELLDAFVIQHAPRHRPIAVVSSGGTAADLELNSVRCLENFSTGLRGAIAVEEFLKRGYAVIHLWRTGSASPYARAVNQYLGSPQGNMCLNIQSLGRLFVVPGDDTCDEDDMVQTVIREEHDPWLSQTTPEDPLKSNGRTQQSVYEFSLNRAILQSSNIRHAIQDRSAALRQGLILTVPFRSVEDYLAKLQLCGNAVKDCHSLAVFFLAAAVSDFYIPREERAEHKIQSQEISGDDDDGYDVKSPPSSLSPSQQMFLLRLRPVPKTIGLLRTEWAPAAFCVPFKLETDIKILRSKANQAVERYGCHMVICNVLHSRHEKVWILAPDEARQQHPKDPSHWSFHEVTCSPNSTVESLDSMIVDKVVQAHFEYISYHNYASGEGWKAAEWARVALDEKKKRIQRQLWWKRVADIGFEIVGGLAAFLISYSINVVLQRRLRM